MSTNSNTSSNRQSSFVTRAVALLALFICIVSALSAAGIVVHAQQQQQPSHSRSRHEYEAGMSRLSVEGIQRGISVESIRQGGHILVLSLGGGSARFSRALSEDKRLELLREFFRSSSQAHNTGGAITSSSSSSSAVATPVGGEPLFGPGAWDASKGVILGGPSAPPRASVDPKLPAARATVSTNARTMRVVLGAAPDFDLDIPERITMADYLPSELLAEGGGGVASIPASIAANVGAGGTHDFALFPDGRLDMAYVDTGVPMVSQPVLLDIGMAQNANTSWPLKVMRGRDCRASGFLMDVPWPEALIEMQQQQNHKVPSSTTVTSSSSNSNNMPDTRDASEAIALDDPTLVEFTPLSGAELITLCYVPLGENTYGSADNEKKGREHPVYIAAAGAKLAVSGPLFSGSRTVGIDETTTVQVLGFNLTFEDIAVVQPTGMCDSVAPDSANQLPIYLPSSSLAEVTVQVTQPGVYDLCYLRQGGAFFVPAATLSVTQTEGRHRTQDYDVVKRKDPLSLEGNVYTSNFRVRQGGAVRLNAHTINTSHFVWERNGVIEGYGSINCQPGPHEHVIQAAPPGMSRQIAFIVHNYGDMVLHLDDVHFTHQGAIFNHRYLKIVVDARRAKLRTDVDSFARRIVNGIRGRIDIVIGEGADGVIDPVLQATALIENLGSIVVANNVQVLLRRYSQLAVGLLQLQRGAVGKIESGSTLEGTFTMQKGAILAFGGGDITLNGAEFLTADSTQLIFNAQQFIKMSSVVVRGTANVILHCNGGPRGRIGPVFLDGTTTFENGTILAIKNVSISAQREVAYLNVMGRLVCHIPSVELGDNIVMQAALNSVFFGSSDESKAKVVPQRAPPNNSAFVLPANASLYLVDLGPARRQQQHHHHASNKDNDEDDGAESTIVATASTAQLCAQYLIVPIHVQLHGDVYLHGCAMLQLGGTHTGSIFGTSSASVIENTNKFAFCKTALAGGAEKRQSDELEAMRKKRAAAHAADASTTSGGGGDRKKQQQEEERIVSVPRDVCISLGSGKDSPGGSNYPMLPSPTSRSSASSFFSSQQINGLALGGEHVLEHGLDGEYYDGDDEHNSKNNNNNKHGKPQIKVDRLELLPRSVLEAATVINLLAHRGILVRPEAIFTASLGGVVGSTILSIEGTFVIDANYPLQLEGTMHVEDNAQLMVRVQQAGTVSAMIRHGSSGSAAAADDHNNNGLVPSEGGCWFPLRMSGGCSFLEQSRILVDASEAALEGHGFEDLSAPILHADAGIIGWPLVNWSSSSGDLTYRGERAVIVRHGPNLAVAAEPQIELPTPYRKKLAVAFIIIVGVAATIFFIARIGTSFVRELLAEPVFPMHLSIAEFWASTSNWFAVLAAAGEAVFLCAPAMIHILKLPPHMEPLASHLRWMITANHTDGWEGPWRYIVIFAADFIFVALWLILYRVRATPESQRRALQGSATWERWYGYAQILCTYMTFFALAVFLPITAVLMEPIACKFLYRGAFDCHHSEEWLLLSFFALITFLVLAPLSGTSLRTPFSHPPFMRDLDIRYKRTYVHLQCVLLGATVSLWKIFGRDAIKLQVANLVMIALMYALYRFSYPCIYDNVNRVRRTLFLVPLGATLAALQQLVRFEGRPSLMCSSDIEYGYVLTFLGFFLACVSMLIWQLFIRKRDEERMPVFDPTMAQAQNNVQVRANELHRLQIRMYNAHSGTERARLAEELADKRVEYQATLRVLRNKLQPMQMRFYLGEGADQLVMSEQQQAARGITGNISSSNGATADGGDTSALDDGGDGGGAVGRPRAHSSSNDDDDDDFVSQNNSRNNNNNGDDVELNPIMSPDPPQCIPASALATPEELRELTPEQMSNYTEGPILGRGTYGTVYMAMLSIGKLVAVKVVPIIKKQKAESLVSIKREVDVLRNLSHPNVIRCYGCSYPPRKDCICIFMELATSGSLTQIVRRFGGLNEAVVQVYTKQILRGLLYLHRNNIVHRDVKGENILIDGTGVAKLGDFGSSRFLADVANKSQAGCASLVGSPFWMAPEVIRNEAYGTKADVWSLGCTVVEMLNGGQPPWSESFDNVYSAMFFIGNTTSLPSNMPQTVSEPCRDFLAQCFDRDVSQRAGVEKLLEHPWLNNVASGSPLSADEMHTAITDGEKSVPELIDGNNSTNTSDNGAAVGMTRNGHFSPLQGAVVDYGNNNGQQPENVGAYVDAGVGNGGAAAAAQNGGMMGMMMNGGAAGGNGGMPSRGWSGLFDGVNTSGATSQGTSLGGLSGISGQSAQSTL